MSFAIDVSRNITGRKTQFKKKPYLLIVFPRPPHELSLFYTPRHRNAQALYCKQRSTTFYCGKIGTITFLNFERNVGWPGFLKIYFKGNAPFLSNNSPFTFLLISCHFPSFAHQCLGQQLCAMFSGKLEGLRLLPATLPESKVKFSALSFSHWQDTTYIPIRPL